MDRGFDPAHHREGAGGAAEFRWLAAQRRVLRWARLAHDLGAALLSRLLAACARRAHPALGDRRGAWHHGRSVLGLGRNAEPPVKFAWAGGSRRRPGTPTTSAI